MTLALLSVMAAGSAAAWGWRQSAAGPLDLRWDGATWSIDASATGADDPRPAGAEARGSLDVMLDLGGWMLLRLRPARGRACWVPVSRSEAGPAWHALRVAVHARVSTAPARVLVAERAVD